MRPLRTVYLAFLLSAGAGGLAAAPVQPPAAGGRDWTWVQGAVFVPTNCVNEAQQWDEYDPAVNDRELHYASAYGINVVRVYLHYLVYLKKRDALLADIADFLGRADKYGIRTEFVFFDDCWNQPPADLLSPGYRYPAPVPGVHNSQWLVCPGDDAQEPLRGAPSQAEGLCPGHRQRPPGGSPGGLLGDLQRAEQVRADRPAGEGRPGMDKGDGHGDPVDGDRRGVLGGAVLGLPVVARVRRLRRERGRPLALHGVHEQERAVRAGCRRALPGEGRLHHVGARDRPGQLPLRVGREPRAPAQGRDAQALPRDRLSRRASLGARGRPRAPRQGAIRAGPVLQGHLLRGRFVRAAGQDVRRRPRSTSTFPTRRARARPTLPRAFPGSTSRSRTPGPSGPLPPERTRSPPTATAVSRSWWTRTR